MAPTPARPSPLSSLDPTTATGRQSPFRRQNSVSPAPQRVTTPSTSPTKSSASLSPTKMGTLSPEKTSPFVRRPSQITNTTGRPSSPLVRPASNMSMTSTISLQHQSNDYDGPATPQLSPDRQTSTTPALDDTPTVNRAPPYGFDGAARSHHTSEDILGSPTIKIPSQANLRPAVQRTTTSSTSSTIKPPVFTAQANQAATKLNSIGGGAYNHVPQPLLHSMRESFEVLDSNNTGAVTSASISDMLGQLGLDNNPSTLRGFFPPNGPAQLNLARYLDILSGPLAELSHPQELRAAFEAFDVDDSGQVDLATLREALLQPDEDTLRMSEGEVDSVLGEFSSRRAFGAKGLNAANKGDVFRYRDFMTNVSGGGMAVQGTEMASVV